jgi:hypothetical protein
MEEVEIGRWWSSDVRSSLTLGDGRQDAARAGLLSACQDLGELLPSPN